MRPWQWGVHLPPLPQGAKAEGGLVQPRHVPAQGRRQLHQAALLVPVQVVGLWRRVAATSDVNLPWRNPHNFAVLDHDNVVASLLVRE
jgi:hypothetical protein